MDTYELDTSQRSISAEDVEECLDDNSSFSDLKNTSLGDMIVLILTMASHYTGILTMCVLDDSLDCSFKGTI